MDSTKQIGPCRCCLNSVVPVFHMFEVEFHQVRGEIGHINAGQSYFELTGLSNDLVPNNSLKICSSCKTLLETYLTFRQTCLESHNILMTNIKEEPHEEQMVFENIFEIKPEIEDQPLLVVKQEKIEAIKPRKRSVKKTVDPEDLKSRPLAADGEETPINFMTAKYVCMFCDVEFKNYAHLIKHRPYHRLNSPRDCNLCDATNCVDFETHVAVAHPNYRPQQCLMCDASYINHKELKQHLQTHRAVERHHCLGCGANFDTQIAQRIHISNKCSAASKHAYRCHICGLVIGKLADVQQHLFINHPKDFRNRYFPCFHCKRILVGPGMGIVCKSCMGWFVDTEKQMQAKNILPQIQCDKCDKKFYEEEAFECHKIGKHSSQAYCFKCDLAFWTSADKRAHVKATHPVLRGRNHKMCDECGKVFEDKYHLDIHLLVHQGKPQHKCPYPGCKSLSYTPQLVKVHIRRSHLKQYKYICHYCGKKMHCYNYIFTHFTRAHFPHLRKYPCDVSTCASRFATITDKKRHMVSHTGEKLTEVKYSSHNAGAYSQLSTDYNFI